MPVGGQQWQHSRDCGTKVFQDFAANATELVAYDGLKLHFDPAPVVSYTGRDKVFDWACLNLVLASQTEGQELPNDPVFIAQYALRTAYENTGNALHRNTQLPESLADNWEAYVVIAEITDSKHRIDATTGKRRANTCINRIRELEQAFGSDIKLYHDTVSAEKKRQVPAHSEIFTKASRGEQKQKPHVPGIAPAVVKPRGGP